MDKSVMDIPENLVVCRCLASIKGYIMPRDMTEGEKGIEIALCRYKLAEYNLDVLTKKIIKGIRIDENDLSFCREDLKKAQLALFDIGR